MSRYDEKLPRLETFSRQFAKRLFARHPAWKLYEGRYVKGDPGLLEYYLEVKIPSGNPQVAEPLLIRTWPCEEVYIQWMEWWHVHIDTDPKRDWEALYEKALARIDLIVSDEYLFGNIYRDGKCVGGWSSEVGSIPAEILLPKPEQKTVIRSWRGTHDREF